MLRVAMLSAILCLTGCAAKKAIVTIPPASCAKQIPPGWADGVDGAPIPDNADISALLGKPLTEQGAAFIQAPWVAGYNAESGKREDANGRLADTIWIIGNCEATVNAARPR